MVSYLAQLRELKPKCLLVKGNLDIRSKLTSEDSGKAQEVEAAGTRESSSKTGSANQRNRLKV